MIPVESLPHWAGLSYEKKKSQVEDKTSKTPEGRSATFRVQGFFSLLKNGRYFSCLFLFFFFLKKKLFFCVFCFSFVFHFFFFFACVSLLFFFGGRRRRGGPRHARYSRGLILSGLLIASLVLCVIFSVRLPICHVSPSHHVLDLRMPLSLLLSSSLSDTFSASSSICRVAFSVICLTFLCLRSVGTTHFYGIHQHDLLQKIGQRKEERMRHDRMRQKRKRCRHQRQKCIQTTNEPSHHHSTRAPWTYMFSNEFRTGRVVIVLLV